MARVALATNGDPELYDAEARVLAAALAESGVTTDVVAWDSETDWEAYELVHLRSTWDYFGRLVEFLDWATHVDKVSRVVNPIDVLRWNSHKGYLVELAAHGVDTIPTAVIPAQSTDVLDQLDECPWTEVVVKAAVDGGGRTARRGRTTDRALREHVSALGDLGDTIVQPFAPSISAGERSLVFLDGRLSHAVLKVPAAGGFLSQPHRGATLHDHEADSTELRVALAAIDVAPGRLSYARIDLVDWEGAPVVMEVEAVEPYLFVESRPERVAAFVGAVRRDLAGD